MGIRSPALRQVHADVNETETGNDNEDWSKNRYTKYLVYTNNDKRRKAFEIPDYRKLTNFIK